MHRAIIARNRWHVSIGGRSRCRRDGSMSIMHRSIVGSILNVWRTDALNNPFLPTHPADEVFDNDADRLRSCLPRWGRARPRDLQQAAISIAQDFDCDTSKVADTPRASLEFVDRQLAPVYTMRQYATLLSLVHGHPWRHSAQSAHATLATCEVNDTTLQQLSKEAANNNVDGCDAVALRNVLLNAAAPVLGHDQQQQEFQELTEALRKVEHGLRQVLTSPPNHMVQSVVVNLYNYIGLRQAQARLLGYASAASQALEHRRFAVDEVKDLQKRAADALVPHMSELVATISSNDTVGMNEVVRPSATKKQTVPPLRIQQYVTLNGALAFVAHMAHEVLGITIQEIDVALDSVWHSDVRFFHVYNDKTLLGAFYLDAFRRPGKTERNVTVPLGTVPVRQVWDSNNATFWPVAACLLDCPPPPWDTDPATLTWELTETLLHEIGHVLHVLMAGQTTDYQVLLGPQYIPLDVSEVLPKFMELWLTEPASLQALTHFSGLCDPADLPPDAVAAAFASQRRRKLLELAELTFDSTLELALFHDFDLSGKESIVELQRRLAATMVPHAARRSLDHDLTPLMDIVRDNMAGLAVAKNRYLLGALQSNALLETYQAAFETQDLYKMDEWRRNVRTLLSVGGVLDPSRTSLAWSRHDDDPRRLLDRYNLNTNK